MTSKPSPAKVTLGMIKGKAITTSVPVIKYHASDDELEELYPSSDDEKHKSESEKTSAKSSPSIQLKLKSDSNDSNDDNLDKKRSSSFDLSQGTPPSDPWKVLSDIKGKITKTFEEKLSEIKSEKKNKRRSRENSSVSDPEDLEDLTPIDENIMEKADKFEKIDKPDKFDKTEIIPKKIHHTRFRFSNIKTGIKTKHKEESVESAIDAIEVVEGEDTVEKKLSNLSEEISNQSSEINNDNNNKQSSGNDFSSFIKNKQKKRSNKFKNLFYELKNELTHYILFIFICLILIYLVPLPEYLSGIISGIISATAISKIIRRITEVLSMPIETNDTLFSVLEIPAVEEHSVVEKYEGWLNELPYNYDPENYHVARTNPVHFKLEGSLLRVMETRKRIPKRAVWNEPQYTVKYTRKRLYNLSGAKVELLPEGLTRRRRWSKKYPICVTFAREGIIEDVILEIPPEDELQQELEKDKLVIVDDETDDELSVSKDNKDIFEDCRDDNYNDIDISIKDNVNNNNNNNNNNDDDYDGDEEEGNNIDNNNIEFKFKIFIFGRTDRQKEDWYRRLAFAITRSTNKRNSIPSTKDMTTSPSSLSLSQTNDDNNKNLSSTPTTADIPAELSYNSYMSRYIDTNGSADSINQSPTVNDSLWVNALIGRVLFDMHKCPDMISVIQDKIQRKLSSIKLPYFMESLMISELVIGQGAPFIHKASKPIIDERGLWIELDLTYDCGVTMTVETKLNLMKLTKAGAIANNSNTVDDKENHKLKTNRSPMFDSDIEDSPETSTEDDDSINIPANTSKESTPTQSSGRKFLSMVDKLAANKYFQHAAELPYVRRAMEGFSNTEIRLSVSVSSIEGCLSVNIPPPPSDRIWYGFKPIPKINLDARPAVGERAVNIGYVTNWIKTKLLKEFDKVVVLPNMDDLVISLCPNYPFYET